MNTSPRRWLLWPIAIIVIVAGAARWRSAPHATNSPPPSSAPVEPGYRPSAFPGVAVRDVAPTSASNRWAAASLKGEPGQTHPRGKGHAKRPKAKVKRGNRGGWQATVGPEYIRFKSTSHPVVKRQGHP